MSKMEEIQKICLNRGIIFPTAEIYSTISGFFDYGPVGTLLKRKFIDYWREFFVKTEDNILEMEGSIVLPEKVFEASGHLKSFVDPITQCLKCKSIQRADDLIQEKTGKFVEGKSTKELTEIINSEKIKCPRCGSPLGEVKLFNLMLKTDISPVGGQTAYLRPETAQNIFTSFQRLFRVARSKLPFGVAQVGRSFRNEISPRHFIIRVREFNQVEIEMFYDPQKPDCKKLDKIKDKKIVIFTRDAQKKNSKPVTMTAEELLKKKIVPSEWLIYFMTKEFEFYKSLGIPEDSLRFREMLKEEIPHYSAGNYDLEINFDFGWKETVGNSIRADHDLKNHMKNSGVNMTVLTDDNRKIIPFVAEPSFGIDRTIAGILLHCFVEDKQRGWNWFKFPAKITPYPVTVFPLVNKDEIPKKAKEVYEMLKKDFDVLYDDSGSIGRRYARADEIGTIFAVTIDYDSLENDTCTIRNRDTTKQVRVKIKDLVSIVKKLINEEVDFEKIGSLIK
jgi:glycyl-tRNA synthetase